jgi:hypothetical protein
MTVCVYRFRFFRLLDRQFASIAYNILMDAWCRISCCVTRNLRVFAYRTCLLYTQCTCWFERPIKTGQNINLNSSVGWPGVIGCPVGAEWRVGMLDCPSREDSHVDMCWCVVTRNCVMDGTVCARMHVRGAFFVGVRSVPTGWIQIQFLSNSLHFKFLEHSFHIYKISPLKTRLLHERSPHLISLKKNILAFISWSNHRSLSFRFSYLDVVCMTCYVTLILDFMKRTNYVCPHHVIFAAALLFSLHWIQTFLSAPSSQTPSIWIFHLMWETEFCILIKHVTF